MDFGLSEADTQQIVDLSGIRTQARIPNRPIPSRVVEHEGTKYKVRAYPSSEMAQQSQELASEASGLVARCYGRVERYVVLEYVEGSHPANSAQALEDIAYFLSELEAIKTKQSPEDDFAALCKYMEAAGIFRPQTIELMRRYFEKAKALPIEWTLEYYDAMPRNFVRGERGTPVAIDEKHVRIGPRGVSLMKPMGQLPDDDFRRLKEAYLAKAGPVLLDDPKYREFLSFYRLITVLGTSAAHRTRHFNIEEHRFHGYRRAVLNIIGAPAILRLREEIPWRTRYRLFAWRDFARRGWGFVWRRLRLVPQIAVGGRQTTDDQSGG